MRAVVLELLKLSTALLRFGLSQLQARRRVTILAASDGSSSVRRMSSVLSVS